MKTKESTSRLPPSLELNGGLDPKTPRQGPSPDQDLGAQLTELPWHPSRQSYKP